MVQTDETALVGSWHNQLGSSLNLEVDGNGGLSGTFHAGVGSAPDRAYPVVGSYDPAPVGPVTVLGFVVDWTDNHSVTVWSGRYDAGPSTIEATWLMTTEPSSATEWNATVVGHDVFSRDS